MRAHAGSELSLAFNMYILAPWRLSLFHPLAPHLVKEIDDDIVLLNAHAVKVLSHYVGQLVLGLSSELFASCDRGGVEPDASRLRQHPFVVVADEGSRRPEAVGSAIRMEDVPVKSGPL